MISGCEKYFAFDVVTHANADRNAHIFDELLHLFKTRAPIPGPDEFPLLKPYLDDYAFPADILDPGRLQDALSPLRIKRIRDSIFERGRHDSMIQYKVPWYEEDILEKHSVDMIFSQAVLEYVDDLKGTYAAMHSWLKPAGYMSHQIDFKCHGTADEWNGHWMYSEFVWKLLRGKRAYFPNREPHSTHLSNLERGFEVVCDKTINSKSKITLKDLAPRFRLIPASDLVTSGAFIQAIRQVSQFRKNGQGTG